MRRRESRFRSVTALLALAALGGCATPQEGPVAEAGGSPIAGLSDGGASASPEQPPEGLLALSGNAMLLGSRRSDLVAVVGRPGASPAAAASPAGAPTGGPDILEPARTAGPLLALNAQPAALVGRTVPGALSPVTVGARSVLTPATTTNPATATTQLANAILSSATRATPPGGGVTPPLISPTAPGGTALGRLLPGFTLPTGN